MPGRKRAAFVFTSEGGIAHFPGLSAPVTIESDKLSDADAAELERLVGAARFLIFLLRSAYRHVGRQTIIVIP
ncbi:MAG: protealysin inhibitor emfourin [Gammaproteobacteria bacterium]